MRMSAKGRRLLIEWEGSKRNSYMDIAGHMTIGCGHLLTQAELESRIIIINGDPFKYTNGISAALVDALLSQDLKLFEAAINNLVRVELNQDQFDALVSFSFNIGIPAFKGSTLLVLLNDGAGSVEVQLRRWNKANGKVSPGLVNRRENEIKLWKGLI